MSFTFSFNDTATTKIYTLSLHDALPIYCGVIHRPRHELQSGVVDLLHERLVHRPFELQVQPIEVRSEEHTSELQSRRDLVCRLLLEKKNNRNTLIASNITFTYVTTSYIY